MNAIAVIYLLLGHAIGDFVLQSRGLAEAKRTQGTALGRHVLQVALAHGVVLIPIWNLSWLIVLPLLVASHLAIDALKIALERRRGESLATFALDQLLHVGCILAAAAIVASETVWGAAPPPQMTLAAACTAAYLLCTLAGSTVVRLVLSRYPLPASEEDDDLNPARMGHAIGVLERSLGLTFILFDAWAGLGGIIAAKSIARFKDLERRHFGEYYLIGTLTSLLITVAFGIAMLWVLRQQY